jgi:hypothetical protein
LSVLLRPNRVGGALNEGLDFHHVLVFQLAGEIRSLLLLRAPESGSRN